MNEFIDDGAEIAAALRVELREAMRRRDARTTRLIRELIAMIDNAQAVRGDGQPSYVIMGGTASTEIARAGLQRARFASLLQHSIEERRSGAAALESMGRGDDARDLREDIETLERLLRIHGILG